MKFKNLFGIAAMLVLAAVPFLSEAASPISSGGSIFPLTFISSPLNNSVDEFNQLLILANAQTAQGTNGALNINTANNIVAFGTAIPNNPLVSDTFIDLPVASVNTSTIFLSGVASRSIVPSGPFTLYASGTAATATSLVIACSGGAKILTVPIAALIDGVPVGPFFSATGVVAASSLVRGCPAGQSIMASTVGSAMTTTTDIFINFPYVVQ